MGFSYPPGFCLEETAVARRRFEMFQYRQALVRMRQGDSDREISAGKVMGRRKVSVHSEAFFLPRH